MFREMFWRVKRHIANAVCRLVIGIGIFAVAVSALKIAGTQTLSNWTAVWVVLFIAGIVVATVGRDSLRGKFNFFPEED